MQVLSKLNEFWRDHLRKCHFQNINANQVLQEKANNIQKEITLWCMQNKTHLSDRTLNGLLIHLSDSKLRVGDYFGSD